MQLGYSEAELKAEPFFNFIHPDDLQATIEVASMMANDGDVTVDFINRYRCKDGSYIKIKWRSYLKPEYALYVCLTKVID